MDTLLVPVLILVLVAAGVLLAIRAWNHRSEHPMAGGGARAGGPTPLSWPVQRPAGSTRSSTGSYTP